jgi:hypothetical protein
MRGRSTWLLLAALIGLGVVAALDALRGGDGEPERVGGVATTSPAADLRRADVRGVLYFTIRSENGCRLRALALPSLQDAASFELEWCGFDVSPEGTVASGPPCGGRGGHVDVFGTPEDPPATFAGCAPAWKPNGDLTFIRHGDVVTPTDVLVRDAARVARFALGEGSRLAVQQLAWLSDVRLAAVVSTRAVVSHVVVMVEDGRPVSEPIFTAAGATIHVSQNGREIFVGGGRDFGFQVFDRRGAFVSGSRFSFPDVAAVADSPDGRWIALARPNNVCIYPVIEPPAREQFPVTCLPFDAVDLAWL